MILISHIIIALSSIVIGSWLFARPTKSKLYANYSLIAATLASGTYLIITMKTDLVSACLTGLVYVSAVTALTVASERKLANQTS